MPKAIIAIGTNDALYGTSNALFIKKMEETIALVQSLGATQVILIPAFIQLLLQAMIRV
jgi:hypothetical protein